MSLTNYNINKLDAALSSGLSSALKVLDTVLSAPASVNCESGRIEILSSIDYSRVEPAMCAIATFSGDANGTGIILFNEQALLAIISQLTNNEESEFDEMSLGMLNEIITQTASDFAANISSELGKSITVSMSQLFDFNGASDIAPYLGGGVIDDVYAKYLTCEVSGVFNAASIAIINRELIESVCEKQEIAPEPVYEAEEIIEEAVEEIAEEPAEEYIQPEAPVHIEKTVKKVSAAAAEPVSPKPSRFKQDGTIQAQNPVFPTFETNESEDFSSLVGGNIDLLMEVPVNVCVEIGKAKKKMKEVMNYSQGSVILLDKRVGEPADITVNGQIIARGEIIVIEDSFGVRITEIINSKELAELK